MRLKRGDTRPDLVINLTNEVDGVDQPVNLTTATAVRIIGKRGTVAAFNDTTPARDNSLGKVTHTWSGSETSASGRITVEVEVTWPGGWVQTFPPNSYLAVDVVDDLG